MKPKTDEEKIEEFNTEHRCTDRDCLLVAKLRMVPLNDWQIVGALKAMADVCPHCCDSDSRCRCSNDE